MRRDSSRVSRVSIAGVHPAVCGYVVVTGRLLVLMTWVWPSLLGLTRVVQANPCGCDFRERQVRAARIRSLTGANVVCGPGMLALTKPYSFDLANAPELRWERRRPKMFNHCETSKRAVDSAE
jgi:hypothetical protein